MNTERTIHVPKFAGKAPINYRDFRESIALALACEGVSEDTIHDALRTTDDAIVNNEHQLVWPTDTSNEAETR